jgi:hypothetical protein
MHHTVRLPAHHRKQVSSFFPCQNQSDRAHSESRPAAPAQALSAENLGFWIYYNPEASGS